MKISYKKLWIKLVEIDISKTENITSYEVINGYEIDTGNIFELDTITEEDFEKKWRVF